MLVAVARTSLLALSSLTPATSQLLALPDPAAAVLAAMQTENRDWPADVGAALEVLPAGHAFTVPEVLFAKISDESRDEWQERFKGIRS